LFPVSTAGSSSEALDELPACDVPAFHQPGLLLEPCGSGSIDWRDLMSEAILLDKTGRRRSPAVMHGYRAGYAPANKGMRYPPDPPRVEEIIAVMHQAGDGRHALRMRGLSLCSGAPGCGSAKR
jgi:hypothetical protein